MATAGRSVMSGDPYIWVAAILTIGVFSFLLGDNPFFAVCEHLVVGLSAGYLFCIYWNNVLVSELFNPLLHPTGGDWWLFWVPFTLGLFWLARYAPKGASLYRLALAYFLAVDLGLAIPTYLDTGVVAQVAGSVNIHLDGSPGSVITQLALVACTFAALVVFLFPKKGEGTSLAVGRRLGRAVVMTGLGASLGYVVVSRLYLLVGRMIFLLHDWLGIL